MNTEKYLLGYLITVNLIAFFLFGIDKHRAKKNKQRISERTLFTSALLGGAIGAWAGMYVFRHKTKHWYFVFGIPLLIGLQIFAAWYFQ